MALIILKYGLPSGTDGAILTAAAWNKLPLNEKIRDDNNNCVLNLDNTFTITNKIYPKTLRMNITSSIVNTAANPLIAKSRLVNFVTGVVLDTSLNVKVIGAAENQGVIKHYTSLTLDKAITFEIDLWTNRAGVFGRAATDGSEERYASVEITIE